MAFQVEDRVTATLSAANGASVKVPDRAHLVLCILPTLTSGNFELEGTVTADPGEQKGGDRVLEDADLTWFNLFDMRYTQVIVNSTTGGLGFHAVVKGLKRLRPVHSVTQTASRTISFVFISDGHGG